MRILQFTSSLRSGGVETFVVDMVNDLISKGHEVYLVTMANPNNKDDRFNEQFLDKKCKVYHIGWYHGNTLSGLFRLPHLIKKIKPDVVHSHSPMLKFLARPSRKMKNISFIYTIHSRAENFVHSDKEREFNKNLFASGQLLPVSISADCLQSYKALYGLDNSVLIENGRMAPPTSPLLTEVTETVNKSKNAPNTPVFVHAGRCQYLKNQDLLIDGFNELNRRGIDFCLIVMGRDYDSEHGLELQKRACRNIHFVGEQSNIGDWLSNADAFCLSSRSEGLPISILEALSYGVTPVCTAVGGIKDILTDSKNAYLCNSLNPNEYADTVERFLKSPIDANLLKEYYSQRFSMSECVDKYLKIYTD